jgi:adenylate cyclase
MPRSSAQQAATSKLAAIMFADIADYARHMDANEKGTFKAANAHLKHIVYPSVARHVGRVLKTLGDGFLAEFDSAASAVSCAVDIQSAVARRNARLKSLPKLEFRIATHVGEILVGDNDIFGRDVNLAARLQAIAEPGGICVSQSAADRLAGHREFDLEPIGMHKLKNISRPVAVYHMAPGKKRPRAGLAFSSTRSFVQGSGAPSIVMLPFTSLVDLKSDTVLLQAIALDISTELSRSRSMILLNEDTAQHIVKTHADPLAATRDMGIQFLLDGTLSRAEIGSRLTLRLTDVENGTLIWAEHFPVGSEDTATALRADVRQQVANIVERKVVKSRLAAIRTAGGPDLKAFDLWLRGREYADAWTPEGDRAALECFEKCVGIDPNFAQAHASIAGILNTRNILLPGCPSYKPDRARADASVARALELDPDDGRNHIDMAWSLMLAGRYDAAEHHFQVAQELSPYDASVCIGCAQGFAYLGDVERGLELARKATWLNPAHPPFYTAYLATIYFLAERYEECLAAAGITAQLLPEMPAWQAAAAALLDEVDEARTFAAQFRRNLQERWAGREACTDDAIAVWLRQVIPLRRTNDFARFLRGLEIAGLRLQAVSPAIPPAT